MTINHNIIAERIVISGVMNNPDIIVDLQNLEPEHFYNSTHKILYYLLRKIYETFKGDKVDPFTLLSTAKNENIELEKDIEASGGLEYLQTLSDLGMEDHPCVCRNIGAEWNGPAQGLGSPLRVQEHFSNSTAYCLYVGITPACAGTLCC